MTSDDTPGGHDDGHSVLLARRHRYTGTLSFHRCWTPGPVPLSKLIAIASARWRIEEDHQLSKQSTGLDVGQVIHRKSWHRWTAICLLAYIARGGDQEGSRPMKPSSLAWGPASSGTSTLAPYWPEERMASSKCCMPASS